MQQSKFAIVPMAALCDARLTFRDLKVLIALLSYANKKKQCHPKRKTLAEDTNLTESRVSVATKRLVEFGWLVKEGDGGRSRPNQYRIGNGLEVQKEAKTNEEIKKETSTESVTVTEMVTVTETVPKTSTETVRGKEQTIEQTISIYSDPEKTFVIFYGEYPKKKARDDALKAWKKLKPDEQVFNEVMEALKRFKSSPDWVKENGKYVPYPASWIRGKRWTDEIDTPQVSGKPKVTKNDDFNSREYRDSGLDDCGWLTETG